MILDTNALAAFLLADRDLLQVFPAHAVLRLRVIVMASIVSVWRGRRIV